VSDKASAARSQGSLEKPLGGRVPKSDMNTKRLDLDGGLRYTSQASPNEAERRREDDQRVVSEVEGEPPC
jgi:hypothetical protein